MLNNMPTFKIPVWQCKCGYSQDFEPTQQNQDIHFNADTAFPLSDLKEAQCPSCQLKNKKGSLTKIPATDSPMSVTVRELTELDNPDLILHGGTLVTRQKADELDRIDLGNHLERMNRERAVNSLVSGNKHVLLTEKDDHGWEGPKRKELSQTEREKMKKKIKEDIEYFSKLSAS